MKHCFIGEHSCYLHNRYMFSSIYLKGRHLSVIFNFIFWALMMRHVFQKEACALLQGNQNWNDWKLLFLKNMDFFFLSPPTFPCVFPQCAVSAPPTAEALIYSQYIHWPKLRIYEEDCQDLSQKIVEWVIFQSHSLSVIPFFQLLLHGNGLKKYITYRRSKNI